MANAKKIVLPWKVDTGVWAEVIQESSGYTLDDADGSFRATPGDFACSAAEDPTIKGRYVFTDSRSSWSDGEYSIYFRRLMGASPSRSNDPIVGSRQFLVRGDTIIGQTEVYDKLLELRVGNMQLTFSVATEQVASRNVDVGCLNYQIIKTKKDSDPDWTNPTSTKTLYFWYAGMGDVNPSKVGEAA